MTAETGQSLPHHRLGRTASEVTLGLGTGALGGFGRSFSYEEFEAVVLAAFDAGVRHFDCAPMYGFGKSEHFLGHLLRTKGLRDTVTLSTKAGRLLRPLRAGEAAGAAHGIAWENSLPFRDVFDYSYDGIMRSFEDSLQRLGLSSVDILLVHDLGAAWHGAEAQRYLDQMRGGGYRALDDLRREGSVKAVGLGVTETQSVLAVADEFTLDCALIAGRYSLLELAVLDGAFEALRERRIAILAAGVFNSGILATGTSGGRRLYDYRSAPPDVVERVRRIEAVCDSFGVRLAAAAIQFVAAHPAVTSVLVGAETVDEIRQNAAALSAPSPTAFWTALKDRGLLPRDAPTPP